MMRNYRKPLVVAAPKILLRHPLAKSLIEDFGPDSSFVPVYVHVKDAKSLDKIDTLFICSGKISYEINALLKSDPQFHEKSAVLTLEELLPFPEEILKEQLNQFTKNAKVVWVQEEPYNSGAFAYAEPHISRIIEELGFKNKKIHCHSRRSVATTATGVSEKHSKEQKDLIESLMQYK